MTDHPLGRDEERDRWGNLPGHSYCHIHNVDEPRFEAFLVCFECGHVYLTPADLERRYFEEASIVKAEESSPGYVPSMRRQVPASEIYFCQECLHDF